MANALGLFPFLRGELADLSTKEHIIAHPHAVNQVKFPKVRTGDQHSSQEMELWPGDHILYETKRERWRYIARDAVRKLDTDCETFCAYIYMCVCVCDNIYIYHR